MTMEEPRRPLKSLAGAVLFLAAASVGIVGINAAMLPYRSGGGMFLGWLLCLASIGVSAAVVSKGLGEGSRFFAPVLLFAISSCLYVVMGGRLPKLLSLRETPVISVKDADQPPHAAADVFHFSDGHVHPRYRWTRTLRTRRGPYSYHVAAVVPEGWKESDPVTLWAVDQGVGERRPESWGREARGGYRAVSEAMLDEYIRDGTARNHLVASARAPMILWEDHPRESLLAIARTEFWILLAVNVLSLATLALPLLRRKRAAP
jgi:hypothetical protein